MTCSNVDYRNRILSESNHSSGDDPGRLGSKGVQIVNASIRGCESAAIFKSAHVLISSSCKCGQSTDADSYMYFHAWNRWHQDLTIGMHWPQMQIICGRGKNITCSYGCKPCGCYSSTDANFKYLHTYAMLHLTSSNMGLSKAKNWSLCKLCTLNGGCWCWIG